MVHQVTPQLLGNVGTLYHSPKSKTWNTEPETRNLKSLNPSTKP